MTRKGMQLPINALIILAIAIIVLLSMVLFFQGTFSPTKSSTDAQSQFRNECLEYNARGCCSPTASCDASPDLVSAARDVGISDQSADAIHNACCNLEG